MKREGNSTSDSAPNTIPSCIRGSATIKDIPEEILLRVFSTLQNVDVVSVMQVCRHWRDLVKKGEMEISDTRFENLGLLTLDDDSILSAYARCGLVEISYY